MGFDLSGKTAVVTGGGSGIGEAISQALARSGAVVHILDREQEAARRVAEGLQDAKGRAEAHACDVSSEKEVRACFETITAQGPIDILVNNAGIAHIGNLEVTTSEDLDRLYSVNIKGVFLCAKAGVASMKGHGGCIINMASVAASVGISDRFAYSLTKGAVLTMTYSIAKDYIGQGIRCNSVSPARIHTPFVDGYLKKNYPGREKEMYDQLSKTQPIGRMGTPAEVAHLVAYLCSDEASFITGTDFPIDGGFIKLNG